MVHFLKMYYIPLCQFYHVNKNNISLCLHEALSNAIIHGNLQVSSSLKEESWKKFNDVLSERASTSPYQDRESLCDFPYLPSILCR